MSGCYIYIKFLSPLAHSGKWSRNVIFKTTLARMTFLLAPKRKRVIFCIESIYVHNTLSLARFGQLLFLGLVQNTCPNLTFTCPGQSGKCLCSTLTMLYLHFLVFQGSGSIGLGSKLLLHTVCSSYRCIFFTLVACLSNNQCTQDCFER